MMMLPGIRQQRRGSMLIWLLLSLTVIVGVVALGMDGGRLFEQRRHIQSTADAAALAAATQLYEHHASDQGLDNSGAAAEAALSIAAANGCSNDGINSSVTVNIPPLSGEFAGRAEFAEVVIQTWIARSFSAIFSGQKLKAKARAVARGRPSPIGIMALKATGSATFRNRSLSVVAAVGSPIIVNSDDPAALVNGAVGTLVAQQFQIAASGYSNGGIMLGPVRTNHPPAPDPLRYLPAPDPADHTLQSATPLKLGGLLPTGLQPGVYRGGIAISKTAIVVLSPGVYIMEGGGFQVSGLATVTGLDVLIYNTSGAVAADSIKVQSLGKVVLTAPSSGTYQGVGIFQDRACDLPLTLKGGALTAISGVVYAPAAPLNLSGLAVVGLSSLGGAMIAATIDIDGIGSINVDLGANRPRVPDIRLVE